MSVLLKDRLPMMWKQRDADWETLSPLRGRLGPWAKGAYLLGAEPRTAAKYLWWAAKLDDSPALALLGLAAWMGIPGSVLHQSWRGLAGKARQLTRLALKHGAINSLMDRLNGTRTVSAAGQSAPGRPNHWTYNGFRSFFRRAVDRLVSPDERRIRRLVKQGHEFPRIQPHRLGDGSVWGISMVKNEADIIESFVRHVFEQGMDRLLVADNGSTDGTYEILQQLSKEFPIVLGRDNEFGYYQAHKMSRLALLARRAGAAWVVPMDADEFWFAEAATVADFLRSCGARQAVGFVHNAFPTPETPVISGIDALLRIDRLPGPHNKAAARPVPGMWIRMGNHVIDSPGQVVTGLRVLHVPWRSFDQFRRKTSQGALALEAAGLPEEVGGHWRRQAALDDALIAERWAGLLRGQAPADMDWVPSADTCVGDVSGLRIWNEVQAVLGPVAHGGSTSG